ncbi:MAG: class I SAM-dependent RNA methyltransferase [Tissierellia bacterium]|nr:class I SAM-dependent RNA methyltransferase [Tissierellia bacterium]
MERMDLIATTTFGLEAVAKRELIALGHKDITLENGKVKFKGTPEDIAKANIWLRTAERVLIQIGEFKAITFDELFEKTKDLPWEDYIPEDANFIIDGKSINSKLFSISDCQKIVEKAIVERLKTKYPVEWFKKSGARHRIEVSLLKDIATLTIDSSGEGLHKRGYRDRAGDAPIKETLAAAMIYLSFWNKDRVLLDPFCGSGTILIEAGMIGRNIAPGLDRSFDAENFYFIDKDIWKNARAEALKSIKQDVKLELLGADIDKRSILRARDNAAKVGLEDDIAFFMKDMRDIDLLDNYGVVITNPPYGERMGEKKEAELLYKDFGKKFRELETWSIYTITSNEDFEKLYGKKADKKRKLYNGRIKVDYYQYYGPRPK